MSSNDFSLAERHSRLRVYDDPITLAKAGRFVMDYFGGDYRRAAWFFDEVATMHEVGGRAEKVFSVRTKTFRPIHLVRNNGQD